MAPLIFSRYEIYKNRTMRPKVILKAARAIDRVLFLLMANEDEWLGRARYIPRPIKMIKDRK